MTSFLLFISLTLHLITFLIVILLFQKVRQKDDLAKEFKIKKREIEDLLAYYSEEIKEENERFLTELSTKVRNGHKSQQRESERINLPREQDGSHSRNPHESHIGNYEASLEDQVLRLYEEGYTANEIAKNLKKGRGEIELLLKFQR